MVACALGQLASTVCAPNTLIQAFGCILRRRRHWGTCGLLNFSEWVHRVLLHGCPPVYLDSVVEQAEHPSDRGPWPFTHVANMARSFKRQAPVVFIDNKAALGSMVGGWSNEDVINDITALTWQITVQMHLYVYFGWVESKANIIDAASRVKSDSDHLVYQSRGWTRVDPVTPWSFILPDDPAIHA